MTPQQHPLLAILSWFDAQPPEVQETIAHLVLMHLPEIVDQLYGSERLIFISDTKGLVLKLRQWLQPHELDRPRDDVGKAVIFRALVDFSCQNRFTKKGWDDFDGDQTAIREQADVENIKDIADMADELIQRLPFRAALWLKAGRSWEQLCAGDLSDPALRLFEIEFS
jgi:hypothetical protein